MLRFENVTVQFPETRTTALRGVEFELAQRSVVIVGANGSGKTTLLRSALGLLPITTGRIQLFGRDPRKAAGDIRVGTNLPEVYRLLSLPVRDLIEIYGRLKGGKGDEVIARLADFELDEVLPKRLFQMSSGQQKMVGNLLAVAFRPELVLLDEPFDNVDFTRRRRFLEILRTLPARTLLTTHELELLPLFTGWQLALMFEGRLVGPFEAAELERLYLSRGKLPGALAVLETSVGSFSVTLDRGATPVKSATSLTRLVEELA